MVSEWDRQEEDWPKVFWLLKLDRECDWIGVGRWFLVEEDLLNDGRVHLVDLDGIPRLALARLRQDDLLHTGVARIGFESVGESVAAHVGGRWRGPENKMEEC